MGEREKDKALATPEFWNSRYAKSDGQHPTHEWFKTFEALEPFFTRNLFDTRRPEQNSRILHLGSGDSTVPYDLAAKGYKNQLCLDFSNVVVELMSSKEPKDGIEWKCADVRNMDMVQSESVDVAFDKGTLDAMIYGSPWSPPDDVLENTGRYINEVFRVLKPDGVFLYITFRQPHFVKPLLNRDDIWDLEMENLAEGTSFLDYYSFILRKKM